MQTYFYIEHHLVWLFACGAAEGEAVLLSSRLSRGSGVRWLVRNDEQAQCVVSGDPASPRSGWAADRSLYRCRDDDDGAGRVTTMIL
jgi:hypothetical protein